MTKRLMQAVMVAAFLAACGGPGSGSDGGSGGGSAGGSSGGGAGGSGGSGGGGGGSATGGGSGNTGGGSQVMGECGLPANEARRTALLAAQPSIETKKKTALTQTVTFPSEGGNASVMCEVSLRFRDSNGNGSLDAYEDWRKTPAERAAALIPSMSADQKLGLLAHATLNDGTSATLSTATQAVLSANVRFGVVNSFTPGNTTPPNTRAAWANAVQEKAEEGALGIPFVLSSYPVHAGGPGRNKAYLFSQWPYEAGLGASASATVLEGFGKVVATDYRAIGVRMALGVPANLATEPRWPNVHTTLGEDHTKVGELLTAYVKGLQGDALSQASVAAVVGDFPGAGAAKGGLDARLSKGKFLSFSGTTINNHLTPFQRAIAQKTAAVMTAYGVPETGSWTGQGGLNGSSIEQVGASFNSALITGVLRGSLSFTGLVIAPPGVLVNPGVAPLGAPWGMETATVSQRIGKAVGAGVDQFMGLDGLTELQAAKTAGAIDDAKVDAAAGRALALMFGLGLFEDPYVDASTASATTNRDAAYRSGLDAMNRAMVLVQNNAKPAGFLEATGKGNAGNMTGKVLPAPPGEAYVAAGCDYFISGDFDLDYVRSVSAGYGNLTIDTPIVKGVTVTTDAAKIALSDYVFIRIADPVTPDPDSGALSIPTPLLSYATQANADALAPLAAARAAITAWTGTPASQAQIVVGIDVGRLPLLAEIQAFNPAAIYVDWFPTTAERNVNADKIFLDVAFGIVNGVGVLPYGFPGTQTQVDSQLPDVAGDGQHPTFVKGYGLTTPRFE